MMKHKLVTRALQLLLALGLAWGGWELVHDNLLLTFFYFLILGAVLGLWVVKVILPRFAEAIGTSVYLSGEKLPPPQKQVSDAAEEAGEQEGAQDSAVPKEDRRPE